MPPSTPPQQPQSSIFRKVSLERLSSPEQLDTIMRSTDPQGWIALITIGVLLLGAIIWSLTAEIPTKVNAKGILLRGDGAGNAGMQEVFTYSTGIVHEFLVKKGDIIKKAQPVAVVYEAGAYSKLRSIQGLIDDLKTHLPSQSAADQAITQQQIKKYQDEYDSALAAGKSVGTVLSSFNGKVVELASDPGDWVVAGTHVLYVEPLDQPMVALIYVSASDASRIKVGNEAQIYPDSVAREEYGCIKGKVSAVDLYPSSPDDLRRKFGNDLLVAEFISGRAAVQCTISLETAATDSGFAWSTRRGPPFPVQSGTLCQGSVVIAQQHPYKLVLP